MFYRKNILIGKNFFVFKYTVKCIINFSNSHYFYWNEGNRFTFRYSLPNGKYTLSYSKPNTQEKASYILRYHNKMMNIFAFLRSWNHVIHIASFRSTRYLIKSFGCFQFSKRVSNWNKSKIHIYCGRNFKYYNRNTNIHIQINVSGFIMNLIFLCVLWF